MPLVMGHCKVLIVDDHSRARVGLRALLAQRQQIEIAGEAADRRGAVRMVAECQPDLVLMDARMPQMDGLDARREIKARWPGVRVFLASKHTACWAAAVAAGVDAFLRKSCTAEELLPALLGPRSDLWDAGA